MKTLKFTLATFLIGAGTMLSLFLVWWTFTVIFVGAPSPDKLRAFAWQFACIALPALAFVFGGSALLQSARAEKKPRERLSWQQIEKILIVAEDGAELLALMDCEPEAAKIVLEGAFSGEKTSFIMTEAGSRLHGPELPTPTLLALTIQQARNLYSGVAS